MCATRTWRLQRRCSRCSAPDRSLLVAPQRSRDHVQCVDHTSQPASAAVVAVIPPATDHGPAKVTKE